MDPLAYQTPVGGPRPTVPPDGPPPVRGTAPVAPSPAAVPSPGPVPELPVDATFVERPAPAPPLRIPELPPDRWPPWLVPAGGPGAPDGPDHHPRRWTRWVVEWTVVLGVALLLAVSVRAFVAQMFYIPSGSMLPTLQVGDRIVVDKLSYRLHGVARGDVVVFHRPPLEQAAYSDLVKRVIGLPGDTVASVGGRVTVDGRALTEPWLPTPRPETLPSPLSAPYSLNHPYTVPPGHYFVMGDNRTDSEDSRYFGPIPGSIIVGKMAFKAWPISSTVWLSALVAVAVAVLIMLALSLRGPARRHRPQHRTRRRGPPVEAGAGID